MHCPWTRKTRAWGYEVIRGIDEDDPLRVIRAFKYPSGLAFVDLNAQVEIDYGGYAWTQWMHKYFGDTALHIALKWKRHRAVKALLSLRPDWTIHNEAGVTGEQLVLRIYGKGMEQFKDEQEREYENDAMRAEEEAMKSLMATEAAERERARLQFLQELHAARTLGVDREAAILFEHGRVILAREATFVRNRGGDATASPAADRGRWVSHVCRELRRNRFAAQRGAMRRNVVPALAPPSTPAGGTAAGARAGTSSSFFSSPATPAGSVRTPARAGAERKSRKHLRSPTSAKSVRVSSGMGKRRTKGPDTIQSNASSGHENEEREGGDILFDINSAVGSGRWPCVDGAANTPKTHAGGRMRSKSPAPSVSSLGGSTRAKSALGRGKNPVSSPISDDGVSIMSGSTWGGGKGVASPGRFDRSSRMSTMRTTRILAAGKSLQRPTPEGRLQQKMAAKSAARVHSAPSPAATAKHAAPPATSSASPRSPLLPVPLVTTRQKGGRGRSAGNSGGFVAASTLESSALARGGDRWPGTVSLEEDGAIVVARESEERGSIAGDGRPQGTSGSDIVGGRLDGSIATRSPIENHTTHTGSNYNVTDDYRQEGEIHDRNHDTNRNRDNSEGPSRGNGRSPQNAPTVASRNVPNDPPDVFGHSSGAEKKNSCGPPTPEKEDRGVENTLGGVQEGPMRDVLAALLTSTVMTEDGGRVLAPTFPSISALRELKYCGPVKPLQASVLKRVLLARPGVLVHLSLAGKRIGDQGAAALAPALAGVRSVDLRSNNIGDAGTVAISSALRDATATAVVATAVAAATPAAAATTAGLKGDGVGETCESPCILEWLSLAGNRIGDAGAEALSLLLEKATGAEKAETTRKGGESKLGRASPMPSAPTTSSAGSQFLGWLSIAGNPGVSDDTKNRLLRAGSERRRLLSSGDGRENDPPAMVIIV